MNIHSPKHTQPQPNCTHIHLQHMLNLSSLKIKKHRLTLGRQRTSSEEGEVQRGVAEVRAGGKSGVAEFWCAPVAEIESWRRSGGEFWRRRAAARGRTGYATGEGNLAHTAAESARRHTPSERGCLGRVRHDGPVSVRLSFFFLVFYIFPFFSIYFLFQI